MPIHSQDLWILNSGNQETCSCYSICETGNQYCACIHNFVTTAMAFEVTVCDLLLQKVVQFHCIHTGHQYVLINSFNHSTNVWGWWLCSFFWICGSIIEIAKTNSSNLEISYMKHLACSSFSGQILTSSWKTSCKLVLNDN